MVRMVPRPGMSKPIRVRGCQRSGTNSSDWSIVLMTRFSTQAVMASGTRISNPVMKYLRMDLSVMVGRIAAAIRGLQVSLLPVLAAGAGAAAGASLAAAGAAGVLALAFAAAGAAPPRKSVAYQPVPLSWKPAA